jgi:hypothetical protein
VAEINRGGPGHVHRLFFERLAHAAEPAVNRGPDADFGKETVEDRKFHVVVMVKLSARGQVKFSHRPKASQSDGVTPKPSRA